MPSPPPLTDRDTRRTHPNSRISNLIISYIRNQFAKPTRGRFDVVLHLMIVLCLTSLLTRGALALRSDVGGNWREVTGAFVIGTGFDVITAVFAFAPLALWLAWLPNRIARWRAHRALVVFGIAATVFSLLLIAASEWFFWDEFGARFNFIAVDYLICTQEVLGKSGRVLPDGPDPVGPCAVEALPSPGA